MQGLIEGRQVHYVMTGAEPGVLGHTAGRHRSAEVIQVWQSDKGRVNLRVSVDGANDLANEDPKTARTSIWVTNVGYSEDPRPGTWHWIERT